MHLAYFLLYLFSGVCFGLAAGGVSLGRRDGTHKFDLVAFGLMLWVLVEFIKSLQKL